MSKKKHSNQKSSAPKGARKARTYSGSKGPTMSKQDRARALRPRSKRPDGVCPVCRCPEWIKRRVSLRALLQLELPFSGWPGPVPEWARWEEVRTVVGFIPNVNPLAPRLVGSISNVTSWSLRLPGPQVEGDREFACSHCLADAHHLRGPVMWNELLDLRESVIVEGWTYEEFCRKELELFERYLSAWDLALSDAMVELCRTANFRTESTHSHRSLRNGLLIRRLEIKQFLEHGIHDMGR